MSPGPRTSVILPVRQAARTIEATLASLASQRHDSYEIVAAVCAHDSAAPFLRKAAQRNPRLRLIECTGEAGVPQLRRDAVAKARGVEYIALAEDHCVYPPAWLSGLEAALLPAEAAVAGGPVANGRRTFAGWAQYFTRYSAFLPPKSPGPATHVPGNNACYLASVLRARGERLAEGFWEAEFNDSLRAEGLPLRMTGVTVEQRQHRGWLAYLPLRYLHGRCYGARRMQAAGAPARSRLWRRAPFIPIVLFARAARAALRSPHRVAFLLTSPLLFAYQTAWAAGEILGYLAGPGAAATRTD